MSCSDLEISAPAVSAASRELIEALYNRVTGSASVCAAWERVLDAFKAAVVQGSATYLQVRGFLEQNLPSNTHASTAISVMETECSLGSVINGFERAGTVGVLVGNKSDVCVAESYLGGISNVLANRSLIHSTCEAGIGTRMYILQSISRIVKQVSEITLLDIDMDIDVITQFCYEMRGLFDGDPADNHLNYMQRLGSWVDFFVQKHYALAKLNDIEAQIYMSELSRLRDNFYFKCTQNSLHDIWLSFKQYTARLRISGCLSESQQAGETLNELIYSKFGGSAFNPYGHAAILYQAAVSKDIAGYVHACDWLVILLTHIRTEGTRLQEAQIRSYIGDLYLKNSSYAQATEVLVYSLRLLRSENDNDNHGCTVLDEYMQESGIVYTSHTVAHLLNKAIYLRDLQHDRQNCPD